MEEGPGTVSKKLFLHQRVACRLHSSDVSMSKVSLIPVSTIWRSLVLLTVKFSENYLYSILSTLNAAKVAKIYKISLHACSTKLFKRFLGVLSHLDLLSNVWDRHRAGHWINGLLLIKQLISHVRALRRPDQWSTYRNWSVRI